MCRNHPRKVSRSSMGQSYRAGVCKTSYLFPNTTHQSYPFNTNKRISYRLSAHSRSSAWPLSVRSRPGLTHYGKSFAWTSNGKGHVGTRWHHRGLTARRRWSTNCYWPALYRLYSPIRRYISRGRNSRPYVMSDRLSSARSRYIRRCRGVSSRATAYQRSRSGGTGCRCRWHY